MLIAVGLLLVTGWWDVLVDWIRDVVLPRLRGGRLSVPTKAQETGPASGYEPPPLRPRELARWAWRQLTSMRTALILLFLLALGVDPRVGGAAGGGRLAAGLAVARRSTPS